MEGWVKIHRKIVENPYWFSEPFTRSQAWIDLILLANHRPGFFYKRGIKIHVDIGQVGYDLDTLGKRWRWSRGKVERFINELETDSQIVRQKNNVTTLLSIVNYKEYQTDDKAKSKPNSKADGQQTVKQTETNKNDKNDKNDKNEKKIEYIYNFRDHLIKTGAEEKLIDEWLDVRKKKKATNSETAFNGFMREVDKYGKGINEVLRICVEKSWKGFSAEWLNESEDKKTTSKFLAAVEAAEYGKEYIRKKYANEQPKND